MASLHSPLAVAAVAHGDIETAHHGPADNLFLILGFAAFPLHAATAMRAVLRQRNRDLFIHPRWGGAACLPTVVAARFPARPLGIGFWVTPRMRRRLTLAGAQRGFQFPPEAFGFLLQPLRFTLEPVVLFVQALIFPLGPIQIALGDKVDGFRLLVCGGVATRFHPTLR